jgi:hypothetical protein
MKIVVDFSSKKLAAQTKGVLNDTRETQICAGAAVFEGSAQRFGPHE